MFQVAFLVLAVAAASGSHIGLGGWGGHGIAVAPIAVHAPVHPAAHLPSGSISVSSHGATVAGPAGSVVSDNGLHSGRAGARLAGPSGTVSGWGAHGIIEGPTGYPTGGDWEDHGSWGGHGGWGGHGHGW